MRRAGLALALLCAGCTSYPNRPVVSEVELEVQGGGAEGADPDAALEGLATRSATSSFLFFSREYDIYDETVLARDLERVERYYRARGYYEAKVNAARVIRVDEHRVRIVIRVDPGQPTIIRSVTPSGRHSLTPEMNAAIQSAIKQKAGDRFDEQVFEETRAAIEKTFGDRGYAFATVKASAKVDVANRVADLEFAMQPGPLARYGSVQIVGLEEIPEGPVRDALDIAPGETYSSADLAEAERALQDLNVFSGIEIQQDKSKPETGTVPIRVVLREGKLRRIKLGGGLRFDVLRLTTHLRTGWEHKNFLGGMRHLSIEAKPGVTWYPMRIGLFDFQRLLGEYYITTELRQPSFIEGRTTGLLNLQYNLYPMLYPLPEGVDPGQETIIGYHEIRAHTGVERKFFDHELFARPSYNWHANFPFAYQNENEDLDPVRASFVELFLEFDTRQNKLEAREPVAFSLSNSFQLAGVVLGGSVSDIRVRPEARLYLRLMPRVSLNLRTGFGFLFPFDYGETLNPRTETGAQAEIDPTDPAVIRDQQKLLFRAFYSGGPSSNRGYPYRAVGPHGPVGFLIPTGLNCTLTGRDVEDLPEGCIRPLGGFSMWEASAEIRWNLAPPLGIVLFADASDVTRQIGELRLNVPHLSVGPGLRYQTPVGPVRLDVGYRVPGAQAIGKDELPPEDGRPGGELFGVLPITLHLAIGEAF